MEKPECIHAHKLWVTGSCIGSLSMGIIHMGPVKCLQPCEYYEPKLPKKPKE